MSRTTFQDDKIETVVFRFAQGQELSEHTAAKPAMLFYVKGEAGVGLDDDMQEAQTGTWVCIRSTSTILEDPSRYAAVGTIGRLPSG